MLTKFTLRISASTLAKLRYVAKQNGRSANKELEQIALNHIAKFEQNHGAIRPEDYKDYLKSS